MYVGLRAGSISLQRSVRTGIVAAGLGSTRPRVMPFSSILEKAAVEHCNGRKKFTPMSASSSAAGTGGGSNMKGAARTGRAEELSWVPSLSLGQELTALVVGAMICSLAYAFTAPARLSLTYATGMALLYAICVWFLRGQLIEQLYQARGRVFRELGDHDSRFTQVAGIHVHAKVSIGSRLREQLATCKDTYRTPQGRPALLAAHCYHGFGANLYSYNLVQQKLADALQGIVTSHDMPGFGLTERPSDTASYFLSFNGGLGEQVLDYEVKHILSEHPKQVDNSPEGATMPVDIETPADQDLVSVATTQPGASRDMSVSVTKTLRDKPDSFPLDLSRAPSPTSVLLIPESDLLSSGESISSPSSTNQSRSTSADFTTQPIIADSQGRGSQTLGIDVGVGKVDVKKVLMGHSLVGLCAALQAAEHPERLAALVLVAPAIVALRDRQSQVFELQACQLPALGNQTPVQGYHLVQRFVCQADHMQLDRKAATATSSETVEKPFPVSRLLHALTSLLKACFMAATLLLLKVLKPGIVSLLRVLVRSKAFWLKGLQQAYYDPKQVTDEVVDAYRLPQLVQGWEAGMFAFLTARLAHTSDWKGIFKQLVPAMMSGVEQDVAQQEVALTGRLKHVMDTHNLPVLIIHGVHDKLVPASNSRRLASMLPGCELAILHQCGHMPQEELPDLFVHLVQDFVQRKVVDVSNQHC